MKVKIMEKLFEHELISEYSFIKTENIPFDEKARDYCKANLCSMYAKKWSCTQKRAEKCVMSLTENLKNIGKCEHRILLVKRKRAKPKPIYKQKEETNRFIAEKFPLFLLVE